MLWSYREMILVPEHMEKELQQPKIFTLLTTLWEDVDENYTHRVTMWKESGSQRVVQSLSTVLWRFLTSRLHYAGNRL